MDAKTPSRRPELLARLQIANGNLTVGVDARGGFVTLAEASGPARRPRTFRLPEADVRKAARLFQADERPTAVALLCLASPDLAEAADRLTGGQ